VSVVTFYNKRRASTWRQVAIDDDGSAPRYRRVVTIKTMTRFFAVKLVGRANVKAAR
jgi:hypothetical protein